MNANVAQRSLLTRNVFRSDATQRLLAFAGLIVLIVVFTVLRPELFFTFPNLANILLATAVNGILALGVTFVIISAGIDLSIGTVMTFSAVMTGVFITNWHQPIWVGVLGGLLTGALAGLINGLVIAKMKVPPFIATLGMLYIAKGLSLIISNLAPIYFTETPAFRSIAMGSIVGAVIRVASPESTIDIPNAVLILFGAAFIGSLILTRTVLGRYTFALGSNEEAARLSGIHVDRWKIGIYTVCGIFSGLAGVVLASRINSAQPSLGQGYELDAIAAVVVGGTSLAGGEGTILGTLIGAFVLSVLTNGLRIMSVPQEWQTVVTGVIVILAVYFDVIRRKI